MIDAKLKTGEGRLLTDPDPDRARSFFGSKSRAMTDKVMSVKDAVQEFIHDGDYMAIGGFGGVRIPTAALHEILRQGRKNLGLSGHTATHDFQILVAGGCVDRCDIAYIIGLEARGLSPNARRACEEGEIELVEWTNFALALRYKAAAMGIPFIPARNILGTDTFRFSGAKEMLCPFTGKKLVAYPALYPDVAIIHVHRCDPYGNCQIDGITIADEDLARASKRLIITTEKLITNEEIRSNPTRTVIPFFCVDAVCEAPFGSYPGNMPYEYYSDEPHLKEWLTAERDPKSLKEFLDRNIFGVENFNQYLEINGGIAKINELRRLELLVRNSS